MVGTSNQLAHAAMCRVADAAPGAAMSFNPLFIHAGSGLGKTHLLSAVAHRIRERRPDRRVMMLTAERFMINFVMALRQRDTLAFKDQFQAVDVLLIDDFQFLQGKTMQQEFCNAFNSLVDQRRQVIVAADVPPAQLDSIDLRMRSRLMGGLVVDIDLPDLETRRRILRSRYETMLKRDASVVIPEDVLDFVASRITGSGRELEGALNRIAAYQQFNQAAVTLDLASLVLRDMQANPDGSRIKIDDILKVVGRHFNVGRTDLLSPRRARSVVVPRQIGMYLAKKMTARSLPEIGRRFGGRDHSTVLHAVRKIEDQIKTDDKRAAPLPPPAGGDGVVAKLVVGLDLVLDLAHGVEHGGMIAATEAAADLWQRPGRHLLGQIHADLAGHHHGARRRGDRRSVRATLKWRPTTFRMSSILTREPSGLAGMSRSTMEARSSVTGDWLNC